MTRTMAVCLSRDTSWDRSTEEYLTTHSYRDLVEEPSTYQLLQDNFARELGVPTLGLSQRVRRTPLDDAQDDITRSLRTFEIRLPDTTFTIGSMVSRQCHAFPALDLPASATAPQLLVDVGGPDSVALELHEIRDLTGLAIHDLARLVGIKRRQFYNLLDGDPTEPRRAARIRQLRKQLYAWSQKLPGPGMLRSALLAPLDHSGKSFLDMASDPRSEQTAIRLLEDYLANLNGARPVMRVGWSRAVQRGVGTEALRALSGGIEAAEAR